MYLLDTNACIDFLDARNPVVANRMEREFGRLAVSAITIAELLVGSQTSKDPDGDKRKVETFAASVEVVDIDQNCAAVYGDVIRKIGVKRHSFDRLIGVQALAHNMTLVTSNVKDFADVPGLKLENWGQV